MKYYIVVALLFLLAMMQVTVVRHIAVGQIVPQMVLVACLAWAMIHGMKEGVIWAFIGGIFLDTISPTPFGIFSISMMIAALLVGMLEERSFSTVTMYSVLILTIVGSFVYSLVFVLLSKLYHVLWGGVWDISFSYLTNFSLLQIVYHVILIFIAYFALTKLGEFMENFENRTRFVNFK
ncbi:MAG: Rod shape-determining protein MreD [uncultured bacterium]|nr:MAG: Rod shape-determining protein MreD [uncultured bacterium]